MKNIIRISKLFLIVVAGLITGCGNNPKPAVTEAVPPNAEQLAQRGEYLVAIMGCNDCHSPKQNGPQGPVIISELMLSGYPANRPVPKADPAVIKKGWIMMVEDLTLAAGPWGISFAANLTSDQSGIGNWTEENFKRALKEGWYKGIEGTRTLLPPMPWTNYKSIADEDVSAIFAYLKSTKPVSNDVPMAIEPGDIK